MQDYHVWQDDGRRHQVRWHGGPQVNLYVNMDAMVGNDMYDRWVEVNVSSRGEWWGDAPELADVDEFARELLEEALHDEDSLFYG